MIKAIIFDCWGTLFTNSQSPHPFEQFADKLGHKLTDRTFVKLFEHHLMREPQDNLEAPIEALLGDLKIPRNQTMVSDLVDILMGSVLTQIPYPDTLDGLARLQKNYKLVLLTNTFKQGYDGLESRFGISKIFSNVITSFESHLIKPDIQLFQDAMVAAGYKPSEMVMVGDNLHDDIEPAQDLGMATVLLDRKGRYPGFKNRATTLDEVEDLIV